MQGNSCAEKGGTDFAVHAVGEDDEGGPVLKPVKLAALACLLEQEDAMCLLMD